MGLFIAGIRFRLIPAYGVLSFSGDIGAEMLVLLAVTEYSHTMPKTKKLLAKARNNPGGLSFDEFKTLLSRRGWLLTTRRGSCDLVLAWAEALTDPAGQQWQGQGLPDQAISEDTG